MAHTFDTCTAQQESLQPIKIPVELVMGYKCARHLAMGFLSALQKHWQHCCTST